MVLKRKGFDDYAKKILKDDRLNLKSNSQLCLKFIEHGYLSCLKYLITEKTLNGYFKSYYCQAIIYEQFDILDWLSENKNFNKNSICAKAVKFHKLSVLKWARSRNYPWGERVCWIAVRKENSEILKWITENGYSWDSDICLIAAKNGKFEILKFIKNNNYQWNCGTYEVALCYGHRHIADWIKENYLPYDMSKEKNKICPLCSKDISLNKISSVTCAICSYNENDVYCSNCLRRCVACRTSYCVQCNHVKNCQSCGKALCIKCMGPRCFKCKKIKCCGNCMNEYQCLDCLPGDNNKNLIDKSNSGVINGTSNVLKKLSICAKKYPCGPIKRSIAKCSNKPIVLFEDEEKYDDEEKYEGEEEFCEDDEVECCEDDDEIECCEDDNEIKITPKKCKIKPKICKSNSKNLVKKSVNRDFSDSDEEVEEEVEEEIPKDVTKLKKMK